MKRMIVVKNPLAYNLPEGYTQVEYIQRGSFHTTMIPSSNVKWSITVLPTQVITTDTKWFRSSGIDIAWGIACGTLNSKWRLGANWQSNSVPVTTEVTTISRDGSTWHINDTEITIANGVNASSTVASFSYDFLKFMKLEIEDGANKEIWIPVTTTDNKVGVYDVINNTFQEVTNAVAGSAIEKYFLKPIKSTIARKTNLSHNLPTGYTEVEYLNGADIKVRNSKHLQKPNLINSNMLMDIEWTNLATSISGYKYVVTAGAPYFDFGYPYGVPREFYSHTDGRRIGGLGTSDDQGIKKTYTFNKKSIYVDGTLKNSFTADYDENPKTYPTSVQIQIKPVVNTGLFHKLSYKSNADNENYTMVLIPCVRNSDNKSGVYDIIGNQFIENTYAGTIVGPKIPVLQPYKPMLVDELIRNFSNCPWNLIADVARANKIPSTWHLGDEKTITLTNGETMVCRICDLTPNRYAYTDGSGSTHMVIEFKSIATTSGMNSSWTNEGGWNASLMRTKVNSGDIYNLLPDDLKSVLKEYKTKAMNGGSQTGVVLTESSDKLFLPTEREIFGTRAFSAQDEWDAMTRFQLYDNNDTESFRIKTRAGTASNWWLRSSSFNRGDYFDYVTSSGNASRQGAGQTYGCSLFFAF